MDASLGLVIEGLVALLLLVTIGHCILLNRKLERLRADQSELRRTIHDLNEATGRAETAIANLRQTADAADERLAGSTECAREACDLLRAEIAQAQTQLDKLATVARASRRAVELPQGSSKPDHPRASSIGIGLLNARQRGDGTRRSAA